MRVLTERASIARSILLQGMKSKNELLGWFQNCLQHPARNAVNGQGETINIDAVPSDHRQGLSIYTRSNLQPRAASQLALKLNKKQ